MLVSFSEGMMEQVAGLMLSTATLVTALGAVIIGILNAKKNKANGESINAVHISINSRMDQLLAAHGQEMRAEGAAEERSRIIPPSPESK